MSKVAAVGIPLTLLVGLAGTVAVTQTQVGNVNEDQDEIELAQTDLQEAVRAISSQVVEHIREVRYQDCFELCISAKECPQEPAPIPPSRCKEGDSRGGPD